MTDIQKLCVVYFANDGTAERIVTGLKHNGCTVVAINPSHTQTTVELLRGAALISPNLSPGRQFGPDAKQARRDQIRRNGGKR